MTDIHIIVEEDPEGGFVARVSPGLKLGAD